MSDTEAWKRPLDPPPGGLARLMQSVEARHARPPPRRARFAFAGAAVALLFACALTQYQREAPRRAFEHNLHAVLDAERRERGIARELPSTRADVRIVVLAPPEAHNP